MNNRKRFMNSLKRFIKDDEGITAIEYAVMAALISIVVIVGAQQFGIVVNTIMEENAAAIAGLAS